MSRRLRPLSGDTLAALPTGCRTCLVWQDDAVPNDRPRDRTDDQAAARKQAWLAEVLEEWGPCGQVVVVDEVVAGYVVYAPQAFLPGVAGFPTAPVSAGAVVLATMYVDPRLRGGGLGRMLVQATARDLVRRDDVAAVEAFGTRVGRAAGCVLAEDFWLAVGFRTQRSHPTYPRMRMDLRSTISWREEVETALERLLGAVRPVPEPQGPGPAQARLSLSR